MTSPILCTVDVVLLTLHEQALHVLLQRREREPFAGALALPGGFIHTEEDASAWHAAERVLAQKTGITSPYLEQLATWAGPGRDPRGWSLSVVYYALVPPGIVPAQALLPDMRLPEACSPEACSPDARLPDTRLPDARLQLRPVAALGAQAGAPALPFDHARIIELAVQRVRTKSLYSSLPVYLCGECFTLPQLQAVYEAVLGEPLNKVSFRRKIEELGMLEAVPGQLSGGAHRPAQLWRLRPAFLRELSVCERGLNPRG